jgi:hypothetical protein
MLDIFFLSYDEPTADKNWAALKSRFPHARRVHGIKGIAAAHQEAARRACTDFFYVVDADAEINEDFDFKHKPPEWDSDYVHIWHASNPAIGIDYGYGGVKLFHKKFFNSVKNQLDFSTSLTRDIKIIEKPACVTRFNSDGIRAFRGAYRESIKLSCCIRDTSKDAAIRREASERLARWSTPLAGCHYRDFILAGVEAGIEETAARPLNDDLLFINDHDLMLCHLSKKYPEIDLTTNPRPKEDNPMKSELFFTTRIASALYDDAVFASTSLSEMRDALSDGQLLSKNWIIEQLRPLTDQHKSVAVVGGWIGLLSLLMFTSELQVSVTSFDLDDRANMIARKINYGENFTSITANMYDIDYSKFDIIINSSSEHIADIKKWRDAIPPGKIIVVQNNNFVDGDGHISTVASSGELREILKLNSISYEGTRKFIAYERYMIIGTT